jgi:hypothetical protein
MMYALAIPGGRMSATAFSTTSTSTILDTPFLRDGTLPPLRRCYRAEVPLSVQREAAALVCEGYAPPAKGRPYAKAHPLWDEAPNHTHALMALLVSVCRGRVGEVTLTRCKSLGKQIGRCSRTVVRQLAILADVGLIVSGHTRGGVRWVALTRAAVIQSKWRPPERLRLYLAADACRTPAAAAKLARAEAYLRDALLAEATMTGKMPLAVVAGHGRPAFIDSLRNVP